jgi:hypothetical protein
MHDSPAFERFLLPFLAGPLKTIDEVEYATMEWVDWYNRGRLSSTQTGYVVTERFLVARVMR